MHWENIAVILLSLGATVQITSRLKLCTTIMNVVPFAINGKKVLTIHFQNQTCEFSSIDKDSQKHFSIHYYSTVSSKKAVFIIGGDGADGLGGFSK